MNQSDKTSHEIELLLDRCEDQSIHDAATKYVST